MMQAAVSTHLLPSYPKRLARMFAPIEHPIANFLESGYLAEISLMGSRTSLYELEQNSLGV
jgi:hypothetical protein